MSGNNYVFISHSSKDEKMVNHLTQMLRDNQILYWKAPEMIPIGSNYAREIPKAIKECSVFLLVVSENSQKSIWVEKELDSAICNKKNVIPIQIDDTGLNDMFHFYLNNVQAILANDGLEEVFGEVKKRILSMFGGTGSDNDSVERKAPDIKHKKSNALRINRIPVECEFCGGSVEQISLGIYRCLKCGGENFDDYQKIRSFLEKVGSAPAMVISRNTGVSVRTIEHFFHEEYLEIPKLSDVRMACQKCGNPIRTGYLCDSCKLTEVTKSTKVIKGSWHSDVWKR